MELEDEQDGRKAPSPESRRRARLASREEFAAHLGRRASSTLQPTAMYHGEEEESGFMETKPIISRRSHKVGISEGPQDDEDIVTFETAGGLNQGSPDREEPRYYRDVARAPRIPLRAARATQDRDGFRQRFLAQNTEQIQKISDTAGVKKDVTEERLVDQVWSPNPPGVNEKIEIWLEEIKRAQPRSAGPGLPPSSNPTLNSETLMQAWPADMEHMLRTPELVLSKLDCSLEEYIDIVCALIGIPVYGNRVEALNQLFTLYLDFKDISRPIQE